jgi:plastocyanin
MEERKTHGREIAGGRASAAARWLLPVSASTALIAVFFAGAAHDGGAAASLRQADESVTATAANEFDPSTVTISVGEKVTWTNGGGVHNVRFVDGQFEMPPNAVSPPWTVARTFSNTGSYVYYCELHGSAQGVGMAGTVIVNAAAPPPPPPPPGGSPPPGGGSPGGGSPGGGNPGPGGDPSPGSPSGGKLSIKVTLKVSDPTPVQGGQVRFFGSVQPEQDGRLLQLQRRTRAGSYRTIKKLKLRDAGTSRSKFGGTLRVAVDAAFRARLPADSAHEPGTSRTRRLNVH